MSDKKYRGVLHDGRVYGVPVEDEKSSTSPACSTAIVERGPWRAGSNSKEWFVESDDFTRDVRLVITGDFADDEQRWAYAREIAQRLNAGGR